MQDPIVNVYQGDYLVGYGMPTVIITADTAPSEELKSEFFVFVEGESSFFRGGQISIKTNGAPEHVISSTLSTAVDEALMQANRVISFAQHEYFTKHKNEYWLRSNIFLTQVDKSKIFSVWRTGKFEKNIQDIKSKTTSASLKAYLELVTALEISEYKEF
ncbi:hypothetical protein [Zhongshania sp.]|jgi:hypothetical protein|uniref:hypothetical protein n=1 Tax=Zhongshania sp. TaxID=1971902 RepID=UPI0039E5AB8D